MTEEPRTPEPDDTAPTQPQPPSEDEPAPGVRRLTRSSSDKLTSSAGLDVVSLAVMRLPPGRV